MSILPYPTPITNDWWTPDQSKAALGSGLQNALITAGLSMLGAPRTPYPQTFTENLARGLGSGFGAFNQTVAGAQQQSAENYWKNRQLAMQEQINKSHSALYDLMAKEKENEINRQDSLFKELRDMENKRGTFTDVSGNTYTTPEVNDVVKMIMEGSTPSIEDENYARSVLGTVPTNQDAIKRNTADFINILKPFDERQAKIDILEKYAKPETTLSALLESTKPREWKPTTLEEVAKLKQIEAGMKPPPSGIQEFEIVTGVSPSLRGTPEYKVAYKKFKEAIKDKETAGDAYEKASARLKARVDSYEKRVGRKATDAEVLKIFTGISDPFGIYAPDETPQPLAESQQKSNVKGNGGFIFKGGKLIPQ